MATHMITLTTTEESLYQRYLALFGMSEAAVVASLKATLIERVVQSVNEAGTTKFIGLSVADKITFLE